MDMSNKSLALLLVAAIVISLGGTLISLNKLNQEGLTGMASGQVQLAVSSNMSCDVDSNVTFGSSGQLESVITLSTNLTNTGTNFTNCVASAACQGLQINNTGNVNINVTFNSSVDGTSFVSGVAADFMYVVWNGTTASLESGCRAGSSLAWANVPTTASTICSNLTWNETNDMMTMEFNVTVGPTTPPGTKTAILTVTCAQN
jgi:hypothetical protein